MLTQRAIAGALGLSTGLVSRYVRRGMPLSSPEAAVAWMDANLSHFHRRQFRVGGNDGGRADRRNQPPLPIPGFFNPYVAAAAAADAGLAVDGERAICLAGTLAVAFMATFPDDTIFEFDGESFPAAGSTHRAELAKLVDDWLAEPAPVE